MHRGKSKPNLSIASAGRSAPDCVSEDKAFEMDESGTKLRLNLSPGRSIEVEQSGARVISPLELNSKPRPPFTIMLEDLKMGHVIGEGNQATVRKVKHRSTGQIYALKNIELSGYKVVNKRTLQQELLHLTSAKHTNVVSTIEAFFVNGKLKLLMEYMDLGTISQVLRNYGPIPVNILSIVTKQIIGGLHHLHTTSIVHRDIKPSNLLLNSKGVVKISDFGVSVVLQEQSHANTQIGSTAYMSPERIRGQQHGTPSDHWSVGITVAECALGLYPILCDDVDLEVVSDQNPFIMDVNVFDLSMLIAEKRATVNFDLLLPHILHHYPQRPAPVLSDELKEFVWSCMQQEPYQRPSCEELVNHRFFSDTPHLDAVGLELIRQWSVSIGLLRKKHAIRKDLGESGKTDSSEALNDRCESQFSEESSHSPVAEAFSETATTSPCTLS